MKKSPEKNPIKKPEKKAEVQRPEKAEGNEMMRLRPYRSGDATEIVTWCKDEDVFYKWSAGRLGEFPLMAERFELEMSARIDNDRYFPFTAMDDDRTVGFILLRHPEDSRDEIRFGFIIVNPEIRGKGYGKKMLQLALKYAFEVYGARKVTLGVFVNNPSAHHCYSAVGFADTDSCVDCQLPGREWKWQEMEMKERQNQKTDEVHTNEQFEK